MQTEWREDYSLCEAKYFGWSEIERTGWTAAVIAVI
jgi:hypothetical protein